MTFEWDDGNLSKLKQVQESGRNFYVEEIESVFADPNQIVTKQTKLKEYESQSK